MTMCAEVIGDPIAHSKSPMIHGCWIDALGLDARYGAQQVTRDALPAFIAARRAEPGWRGCNVTLPHKQAVIDLVEDRGNVRATIGAMNTLFVAEDGALVGTNTDAAGFFAPLAEVPLDGGHVVLVGSGGAARAVLYALARAHVGEVTLLARSPLKAAGVLAQFGLRGRVAAMNARLPPADLLVNASPLGMTGQPALPLDLAPLPAHAIVYDLVYAPLETPLLAAARRQGLDVIDGLDMLIGQAALAFSLFFGVAPPDGGEAAVRALLTA